MSNAKRLIVGLVVLVGGLGIMGCQEQVRVQTPPELVKAIEAGDVGLVETIVGVNPKLVNSMGNYPMSPSEISPLYYAVWTNNNNMVKLLLEKGANINTKV